MSIGITSAHAPLGLLWTETLGVLLERLEFFTIFVGGARLVQDGRITLRTL